MSTQPQERPREDEAKKKPARAAETQKTDRQSDPTTTPHVGSSRKVDPEELNPDDFE